MQDFNMAPFLATYFPSNDSEKFEYDLHGTLNHMGNIGSGHYTAHAKHPITNEWHTFDDSRCTKTDSHVVQSSSHSYILFYVEKNFKATGVDFSKIETNPMSLEKPSSFPKCSIQ